MKQLRKHREAMDMTEGPLLGNILRFSLPVMLTGILQLLYNAADIVVVGRFAGPTAMAAVGSTGSLINLIVNVFMGLSIGASVAVAQYYGAHRHKDVSQSVHTSIAVAFISGIVVMIFGVAMARTLLEMMGTPEDVLDLAVTYIRIYFMGMPFAMVYNFGAAILRAVGDTRRPLYFLTISGLVNVVLNVVFVAVFNMSVAGVALSTAISQVIAVVLIVLGLTHAEGSIRLDIRKIRIYPDKLKQIARVGIPAGLQGSIFSVSNVLIQSSINSFGSSVMAGNAASANIEGFAYTVMNALYQAALTFTGQNIGARKPERIGRILWTCQAAVMVIGLVFSLLIHLVGAQLLGIYSSDAQVVDMGMRRLELMMKTYFLCGMMDTFVGVIRGMGNSLLPMIVSTLGACVFRIVWVYTVFAADRTLSVLYISYPISWAITAMAHFVCYLVIKPRVTARIRAQEAACASID